MPCNSTYVSTTYIAYMAVYGRISQIYSLCGLLSAYNTLPYIYLPLVHYRLSWGFLDPLQVIVVSVLCRCGTVPGQQYLYSSSTGML